jgi:F-type H+-transporting ATPase subunit a
LIRPGALRVRLAANIVAGHLLLRLLRNQAINLTFIYLRLLFLIILLLLILESAVAVIQSYVFSVLTLLYIQEINTLNLI